MHSMDCGPFLIRELGHLWRITETPSFTVRHLQRTICLLSVMPGIISDGTLNASFLLPWDGILRSRMSLTEFSDISTHMPGGKPNKANLSPGRLRLNALVN